MRSNLLTEVASILLLVHHFPEPFVHLVLFHFELLGQLQALLSGRHLAFRLLEDGPQNVHLICFFAVALSLRFPLALRRLSLHKWAPDGFCLLMLLQSPDVVL